MNDKRKNSAKMKIAIKKEIERLTKICVFEIILNKEILNDANLSGMIFLLATENTSTNV